MSEKKGVEIDYCPECRGVWLDRGELDKLIAAEEQAYKSRDRSDASDVAREKRTAPDDYDKHGKKMHHRKRESFLGDIFEMFGD